MALKMFKKKSLYALNMVQFKSQFSTLLLVSVTDKLRQFPSHRECVMYGVGWVRSEAVDVLLSCRVLLLPAAAARRVYPGHGNRMPHHQSCQPAYVLP
jgi:hypothetical protein